MKIYVATLGCKVNQYESQAIIEEGERTGFLKVFSPNDADVIIVNSCTVTETSVKKAQKLCRRFRRENPEVILVLCGCMPQVYPNNLDLYKDIDIVMGNTSRKSMIPNIHKFIKEQHQIIDIVDHNKNDKFEELSIKNFGERTRAFMKIEDGCENFCSYCMIPFARGFIRSKSLDDIREEANLLANGGYKEVVLTGINLSAYGKDLGLNLCDAVEEIAKVEAIERIRLSSLEPDYLSDDIIDRLSKTKKLCPQFHLALQSGCDATLARMNRHYNTARYLEIAAKLKANFDNCSFTTDVMVGFPGETDDEFAQSLNFVQQMGFLKVHVFSYSKREGTAAAVAKNQVDPEVKKERSKRMMCVAKKNAKTFLATQVGKKVNVLFENCIVDECYEGFSKNYSPVHVKSCNNLLGKVTNVKIIDAKSEYLIGELVD